MEELEEASKDEEGQRAERVKAAAAALAVDAQPKSRETLLNCNCNCTPFDLPPTGVCRGPLRDKRRTPLKLVNAKKDLASG